VNRCSTTAEETWLADVHGLPDRCLCTSCTVPSASKLSRMRLIVITCCRGSVENTPPQPLDFAHTLKFLVPFQYYNATLERQTLRRHSVLQAALGFVRFALSREWTSHHVKYLTLWFHNGGVRKYPLLKHLYSFKHPVEPELVLLLTSDHYLKVGVRRPFT